MRYTELELSSHLLDQPYVEGLPSTRLLILSTPRSGSYMLCRMMLHAGLGIPHEYFNDIHIRRIGPRFGVPGTRDLSPSDTDPRMLLRYLHALFAHRTRHGLFAAKIQYSQFHTHLRGAVGAALFDGAVLVYLTRQDLLAQAVSLHFAKVTGRWSFENTRLTRPEKNAKLFDHAAIERILASLYAEQTAWEEFFIAKGISPLRTTYEDTCRDSHQVLRRIAASCNVDAKSLHQGYDDQGRYPTEPSHPTKAAVMEYFLVARLSSHAAPSPETYTAARG